MLPSYAILVIRKLEFLTSIVGVGVVVPSVTPLTYLTDTLKQQFLGTVIIAVLVKCENSSTACGGTIARLLGLISPFTAIAIPIGVTSPFVGIATFPL